MNIDFLDISVLVCIKYIFDLFIKCALFSVLRYYNFFINCTGIPSKGARIPALEEYKRILEIFAFR